MSPDNNVADNGPLNVWALRWIQPATVLPIATVLRLLPRIHTHMIDSLWLYTLIHWRLDRVLLQPQQTSVNSTKTATAGIYSDRLPPTAAPNCHTQQLGWMDATKRTRERASLSEAHHLRTRQTHRRRSSSCHQQADKPNHSRTARTKNRWQHASTVRHYYPFISFCKWIRWLGFTVHTMMFTL